jgi:hypothetical protein
MVSTTRVFIGSERRSEGRTGGKDRGLGGQKVVVRYSPDKNDLSVLSTVNFVVSNK